MTTNSAIDASLASVSKFFDDQKREPMQLVQYPNTPKQYSGHFMPPRGTPGSFSFGYSEGSALSPLRNFAIDRDRLKVPLTTITPPVEPDMNELTSMYRQIPTLLSSKGMMKRIDDAIQSSEIGSRQAANNAARSYAARMMQSGISSPIAEGAVRGQLINQGNRQAADIRLEKEQLVMQQKKESAALASQVASQIASLRDSYSKTLADFNTQQAGLTSGENKFNATGEMSAYELEAKLAAAEADMRMKFALSEGGGKGGAGAGGLGADMNPIRGGDFYPGYIPTFGPLTGSQKNGLINPRLVYTTY